MVKKISLPFLFPFLPGLFFIALCFYLSPDRIFSIWPIKVANGGINFLNMRLFQISLFAFGSWLTIYYAKRVYNGFIVFPVLLFLLIGHYFLYGLIDDTYISLRYAKNFALGNGLVFNLGERVEGYTCFLWVCLLGFIHFLTKIHLEKISFYLSLFFGCLTLIASFILFGFLKEQEKIKYFCLLILACFIPLVFWSYSGMETSFYTFLLVSATICLANHWEQDQHQKFLITSAVLFSLAGLTRPETYLFFIGNVFFIFVFTRKEKRIRDVLYYSSIFLGIVGIHILFRLVYYGFLLPNTFYAKVDYSSFDLMKRGLIYICHGALSSLPLFLIIGVGFSKPVTKEKRIVLYIFLLVLLQLAAIFYTGGDHFRILRYFVYLSPFLVFLSLWGIGKIPWGLKGKSLLILAVLFSTLYLNFFYRDAIYFSSMKGEPRIAEALSKIGLWLKENAKKTDWLATPVVGAMPYHSELNAIDVLGLTDKTISHKKTALGKGKSGHEKWDWNYVLDRKPRYIYVGGFLCQKPEDFRKGVWLPAYKPFYKMLPIKNYQIITGKAQDQDFCFLKRVN